MLFIRITPLRFARCRLKLPDLLGSTKFLNVLRKSDIKWIKISPYAPSQGGNWESIVKLFKNALYRILHDTRRLPSPIEL